ncbi:hypothetical protein VD0004_g8712 [Verticillium dahliae]|nr:hypothetical protein VD0004_g8712 [Verticillium dahliae]
MLNKLWEFGGVEGWNSNPNEGVYFYANYKGPPVIPLIWTQRLTDASLAVALLSIFIMVARMVMTSCGQMSRTFSMLYDAFLAFVWIYSVSLQASGDFSDMEHLSPHPCQVETVTFVAGAGSSVIWDVPPANDASNEPLIMATHLWARAYLGSCFYAPQDRRETALHLGNTLRSVALAIQDRDKGTSDSTILAVWILGMYELQIGGISGQSSRKSAWHVHLEGLLSLLRARGKAQFYTPFGRYIFWCVFMTLQTGCLMANEACPPESDEWVGLLEDTRDPDEGWSLLVCRYICKACSLICTIFPIVCEGLFDEARQHYHSLLEQVSALEHECLRWMAQAAPEELAPSSHTHFFWNIWRSARLKLHNLFFMLANLVLHTPTDRISQSTEIFDSFILEATKGRCLAIVATAAQETIDSIPVSLGGRSPEFATATYASWFEGMSQISPLSHVYTTRTVPKHLRNTARLALLAIGKERGILQAFKTRPGAVQYAAEATVGISLDDTMESVTEVT